MEIDLVRHEVWTRTRIRCGDGDALSRVLDVGLLSVDEDDAGLRLAVAHSSADDGVRRAMVDWHKAVVPPVPGLAKPGEVMVKRGPRTEVSITILRRLPRALTHEISVLLSELMPALDDLARYLAVAEVMES